MPKKTEKEVCAFCGPYEDCDIEKHTPKRIRDLLVDANIIEDTETAWNKWLDKKPSSKYKEADKYMYGHEPRIVVNAGLLGNVAKWVRTIL